MREIKPFVTVGRMWADSHRAKFTDSLARLLILTQRGLSEFTPPDGAEYYVDYEPAPVSYHELARNVLAENMRGEWLFQLDTDHAFAPDTLIRLFRLARRYEAKVISGVYQYKTPPHGPVMSLWGEDGALYPVTDWDRSQEVMAVGAVGAGCLLVHRSVFREIREKLKELPFKVRGVSEDYSFCQRCKEVGVTVYAAPNVECHHVIDNILSLADYAGTGKIVQTAGGVISESVEAEFSNAISGVTV